MLELIGVKDEEKWYERMEDREFNTFLWNQDII